MGEVEFQSFPKKGKGSEFSHKMEGLVKQGACSKKTEVSLTLTNPY